MKKKGILFTFLAIVIASLLSVMYSTYQITPLDHNIDIEKTRVKATNQYLSNVMAYAQSSLKLSAYRGLEEMIDEIHATSTFYGGEQDINDTFREIVINGTIDSIDVVNMENITISYLMKKIQNVSETELGIDMNYTINDVWIDQRNPFSVSAFMNYTITVRKQNVYWNKTISTISKVTIEGLKDPLFFGIGYNSTFKETVHLPQRFNKTSFEEFVNNSEYIVTPHDLINITGVAEFRPKSFFGRLTDNDAIKNGSTLTLLSIVSPERLENEALILIADQPGNYSYVDFMYGTEFDYFNCRGILKKVFNTTNQPIVDRSHLFLIFNLTSSQLNDTDTC